MPAFDLIQKSIEDAIEKEDFNNAILIIVDNAPAYAEDDAAAGFFTSILRHEKISLAEIPLKSMLLGKSNAALATSAELFFNAEKPGDAKWICSLVLSREQENQKALEVMADIYSECENEQDKALANLDACITIEKRKAKRPDYIANWYADKGQIYLAKNDDPVEAEKQCRSGLAEDAKNYYCTYNLSLALKEQEKFREADEMLSAAVSNFTDVTERGDLLYNLGELNDLLYKPHRARDYFQQALKCDDKMVYAHHNLVTVCRYIGEFSRAVYYTNRAFELYAKEYDSGAFKKEPGKYYYYAEMIRDYKPVKTEGDYQLWEKLLQKYISLAPGDADGPGEMFKMFLRKKNAIESGEIYANAWHGEWEKHLETCHSNLIEWYDRAVEAFTNHIANAKKKNDIIYHHLQLGSVYRVFELYDRAKESFQAALDIDPDNARANECAGVACFKAGEFPQAIEYFKKAVKLHPGSFNLESNLADSYRAAGRLDEAESIYRQVLNRSPKYLDALIGLGECNKSRGDEQVETGDSEDASEYFAKAVSNFEQVFDLRNTENSSKQLTKQEQYALYYSLGYSKVRLYEAGKGINLGLLLGAKKSFRNVGKPANEYLKSQKAIRLINQKLLSYVSVVKMVPGFLFVLSLLLFLATQYVTFKTPGKAYMLNRGEIMAMASRQMEDTVALSKSISPYLLEEFSNLKDIKGKLAATIPAKVLDRLDMTMIKEKPADGVKLDTVSYISITFGALGLMIVALFLPSITKLKLGAVEMDKNAVDTVRATTSIIKT